MPFGLPSPLEAAKRIKGKLFSSISRSSQSDDQRNHHSAMRSSQDSVASSRTNHDNRHQNFIRYSSARPGTSHGRHTTYTPVNTNPSYRQHRHSSDDLLSKNLSNAKQYADDSQHVEWGVYNYTDSMADLLAAENQEERDLKARRERENRKYKFCPQSSANKRKSKKPQQRKPPETLQPLDVATLNQQRDAHYHAPRKVLKKIPVEYDGTHFPPPGDASLQAKKHQHERNQQELQRQKQPSESNAITKFVKGWLSLSSDVDDTTTPGKDPCNTTNHAHKHNPSSNDSRAAVMNSPSDPIPRRKKKESISSNRQCVDLCDGDNSATDEEPKPPASTTSATTTDRKTQGQGKPFEQRTKKRQTNSSSIGIREKHFSKRTPDSFYTMKSSLRNSRIHLEDSSDDGDSRGNYTRDLVNSISDEVVSCDNVTSNDASRQSHDGYSHRTSTSNSSPEDASGNDNIALRLKRQQKSRQHKESTAKKRKIGRKIPMPTSFIELDSQNTRLASNETTNGKIGTSNMERPSKKAERMYSNESQVRRSSRISAQKKKPYGGTADSAIDIMSSEDESIAEVSPSHPVSKHGIIVTMEAIRIAIGKKVLHKHCKITYDSGRVNLKISYSLDEGRLNSPDKDEVKTHCIDLIADLREMKFHLESEVDGDEDLSSFLALNVKKSDDNGLKKISNAYQPDGNDSSKRYIVIEFRNDDDFTKLLDLFRCHSHTKAFVNSLEELPAQQAKEYCQALFEDSEKAKKRRSRVSLSSDRTGFLKGKVDTDVLLQYPFEYHDQSIIDLQAKGLRSELSEVIDVPLVNENVGESTEAINDFRPQDDSESPLIKKSRFCLQITVADFERLEPGEYLNDTLIDFWLHWIWRNTYQAHVHVFSTQFYTALVEGGPQAVVHWTKNRGIDIFRKKFIFIPINKDFHWSLTVIVNPGQILEHTQIFIDMNSKDDTETTTFTDNIKKNSFPFFLFFDSLKAHRKDRVANTLMEWLNSEWARMKPDGRPSPFKKPCMQICSPDVPQQENGCDCGVFVCRYAYAMKKLSHLDFTYEETKFVFSSRQSRDFCQSLFVDPFNFGMDDIAAIREDMKLLIHRLSHLFIPWKKEKRRKEKEERLQNRIPLKGNQTDKSNFNAESCTSQNGRPRDTDDEAGLPRKARTDHVELSGKDINLTEKTKSLSFVYSGTSESVDSSCSPSQQLHALHDIQSSDNEEKVGPEPMDWEEETQV